MKISDSGMYQFKRINSMKKSTTTRDTVFNKSNIPEQLETTIGYNEQERMQLIRQSYIDIINIVSDAIYVLDESFSFIEVNKGAEKMYQFTREELIGQTPDSVAAPGMNDMPVILSKMKSVLETSKEVQFDFWAKRKNGEIFPKSVIINKGKFFEQNVLIATARDITEQKKVEQELNELKSKYNNLPEAISKQLKSSENLHQSILQTAMDGYWMVNKKGKILEVNDSYCQMIGYTNEELLKMWVADIEYNESQADVEAHIQYVLKNGSGRFETRHQRKDKTIINLDVSIQQQIGTEDVIAFFRDITERKLIENELFESEKKYKILFSGNPQSMFIYDLETLAILEVNQTAVDFYGYSRDEFLSMTVKELHPAEEIPAFLKSIEDTRMGKNTDGISLHQKKNADKVYVKISATSAPIFGENARHLLVEDTTQRLLAEQKLIESEMFFRQSQQAANIGSYHLDLTTGLWGSSDVLDDIFGIDKEYVRSVHGWLELVSEEDQEMMNDYFTNYVLGQKKSFNKEFRISRKSDAKVLWVLGLGELTIENGVVKAMKGTIQVINDRKLAETTLKEKMTELMRFHNLTVDRELNMIQLKKEINDLRLKIGLESKYKIVE